MDPEGCHLLLPVVTDRHRLEKLELVHSTRDGYLGRWFDQPCTYLPGCSGVLQGLDSKHELLEGNALHLRRLRCHCNLVMPVTGE